MAQFEALYERKCRPPSGWFEVGETKLLGSELVQQAVEKVKMIRGRLLTAQSSKNSYSDNRRQDLEFVVGDWIFLRVSLMKGMIKFKGGQVAYKLELPQESEAVHLVLHVSMLRKCLIDLSYITPIEDIQVMEDLSYKTVPVAILDHQACKLQTKEVASVKLRWRNNNIEEMTRKAEEDMNSRYPHLFHAMGGNNETTMAGTTLDD
ncbi:uncharacterized protein [Nicotiana tomentosiformis]|uniref:Tf2-1-like SH3-like domain-containing protein n=1 Tax=Nicotiana tabacum TaxID=4097 RepID=A0A1S4CRM5_TOBAC|nr:uncharacterized protein LOC104105804 [Nicotiana tomentosiformis]XP_016503726.1 PREDICTED: uncharacterized protein LOC107821787 [Nicotiana tabacum]